MKAMITCIIISLFALTTAHSVKSEKRLKYTVLAIEYIGESDKPIFPVVISDSKAGAEWCRRSVLKRGKFDLTYEHVIGLSLLEKLIADATSQTGVVQQEQGKEPEPSKTVSATIVTPQRRRILLYDTSSATLLLDSLKEHCKDDKSLHSDLEHLQSRIRNW